MSRRTARETVFKLAFEYSFNREFNSDTLELMTMDATMTDDDRNFVESTYKGVINFYDELKSLIEKNISGYTVDRIYRSDFIVLMVACYELKYTDTPFAVVINEAVELAKKYGEEKSGKFVNGVLKGVISEGQNG